MSTGQLAEKADNWSFGARIAFRFGTVYVLLCAIGNLNIILNFTAWRQLFRTLLPENQYAIHPGLASQPLGILNGYVPDWYLQLVPQACQSIQSAHYCWVYRQAWSILLALAVGSIWSLVDAHRPNYQTLARRLTVGYRYVLLPHFWGMGLLKVTGTQFGMGFEGLELALSASEMSPSTFMWSAMGVSYVFQLFTGLGEVTGSLLLFFRRTATLGALVLLMVCTVITTLNFVYSHPLAGMVWPYIPIAIAIVAYDSSRLRAFYISNHAAVSSRAEIQRVALWAVPVKAYLLWVIFLQPTIKALSPSTAVDTYFYHRRQPHPLSSAYIVDRFVSNGREIPSSWTDSTRWQYVDIGGGTSWSRTYLRWKQPVIMEVYAPSGSTKSYSVQADTNTMALDATPIYRGGEEPAIDDSTDRGTMSFRSLGPNRLELAGVLRRDTLTVILRKVPDSSWSLRRIPRW